jgi:hypothetical protein
MHTPKRTLTVIAVLSVIIGTACAVVRIIAGNSSANALRSADGMVDPGNDHKRVLQQVRGDLRIVPESLTWNDICILISFNEIKTSAVALRAHRALLLNPSFLDLTIRSSPWSPDRR